MKVAVFSESEADEAAIRVLVDALLVQESEPVDLPLRAHGWPGVREQLPVVWRALYYQTDADALVVVVDSNKSPLHQQRHEQPGEQHPDCRLCQLRGAISSAERLVQPRRGRLLLKTAVGLAVPQIEAWYRCGVDPHVTEAVWAQALQSGSYPYTKTTLKQVVYGTKRPTRSRQERAIEEARRLGQNVSKLEEWFPSGFGALARDVRSWFAT